MVRPLIIVAILVSALFSESRIENNFKCIDNKLFIQTVVYERTQYGTNIVSASLVQVLSQWGRATAVTDCKTHDVQKRSVY